MKNCTLNITTTVDGIATSIQRNGQASLTPISAHIIYKEENAVVEITLSEGLLHIERRGDYTQSMYFCERKRMTGKLGIGGADGEIHTHTDALSFSLSETALLLSMHYVLLIGDEPQNMKIRLFVKLT